MNQLQFRVQLSHRLLLSHLASWLALWSHWGSDICRAVIPPSQDQPPLRSVRNKTSCEAEEEMEDGSCGMASCGLCPLKTQQNSSACSRGWTDSHAGHLLNHTLCTPLQRNFGTSKYTIVSFIALHYSYLCWSNNQHGALCCPKHHILLLPQTFV